MWEFSLYTYGFWLRTGVEKLGGFCTDDARTVVPRRRWTGRRLEFAAGSARENKRMDE
jgi:hypothetical protein